MRKQLTVGSLIAGRSPVQTPAPTPVSGNMPETTRRAGSFSRLQTKPQTTIKRKQVTVKQHDQTISVEQAPCQTLLQAALAQGQPLSYKCRQGYCGKCRVLVVSGTSLLDAPTKQESEKLDQKLASGYRLACQSTFRSTILD
ncbi:MULTISPECIES: 2Fe-2S iron-sulfur cluster-binding protein [Brevibacillus]|jgi:ferredoxin|uniref:2Fe-2S iron-sulfur cluster-binding protein n=1 Tax=Brevibacillus TaxID=55080 RepID=UPI0002716D9F|nr:MULTISPECIES: 2Fe-2S iron-sulfur cluster-binding protein [Brevibacillus]EJL47245.1 ferredoxin [Brevibacillus sp. CF112]MED1822991.1 2Fe-2S iron-sulfur cluster-binding protein [Brevibacillus agri]MED4568089.1 2Fe-2S iron-sulfur cluster-binding protein [Brevibacillus agri]